MKTTLTVTGCGKGRNCRVFLLRDCNQHIPQKTAILNQANPRVYLTRLTRSEKSFPGCGQSHLDNDNRPLIGESSDRIPPQVSRFPRRQYPCE